MKTFFCLFAVLLITGVNQIKATETWVNNSPGAFITSLAITPEGPFDQILDPLNQYVGWIEITFSNGTVRSANLQHANHSSLLTTPGIDDSYQYIAVYFCDDRTPLTRCDAVALKLENGKLCVAGFQFIKQVSNMTVSLHDLGCFSRSGLLIVAPRKNDFGNLAKFSKEEILDLVYGRKRLPDWPRGPICLSCPPWPEFTKELDDRIAKNLKKKFEVTVKQLK